MLHAPADAHIRLALHADHLPSVTATATGPTADAARSHLYDLGFRTTGPTTMVLARIDREEPHYAACAADLLRRYGFTVEIDPALQAEIDEEWTRVHHPEHSTREDIRRAGAQAQSIHDDIAEGRLVIHFHANVDHTTVAVGTYASGTLRHVHLHGEDHLRQITEFYANEAEAVAEFKRLYSVAVRPGPAPLTELEQTVRHVLHADITPMRAGNHTAATPAGPPAAGPGEHEDFLTSFLEDNPQWEKYRTWSDETTIASHESLTARAEFDHEARHRTDTAWTVAEYNGPVGERLWHASLTAGTPVPLIKTLLQHLDAPLPVGAAEPHEILRGAGWHPSSHPARTTWRAPNRTLAFEQSPHAADDRWTLYGGEDLDRAAWTIRLSVGVGVGKDILTQLASTAAVLAGPPHTPAPQALARRIPATVTHPRPRAR